MQYMMLETQDTVGAAKSIGILLITEALLRFRDFTTFKCQILRGYCGNTTTTTTKA